MYKKTLKKLKITLFFVQVGTVIDKRLKYPEFFVLLSKRRFDDVWFIVANKVPKYRISFELFWGLLKTKCVKDFVPRPLCLLFSPPPQNVKCRICKYKLIIQLVVFLGRRQDVMACNWVKTPTQICHLGFKVNCFMWGIVRSTSVLADIWQHNSPHSIDFKTFYIINI